MLERISDAGKALRNIFKRDDDTDKEKSSVEKLIDFQEAKEEADKSMSEAQKAESKIEDYDEDAKNVEQILKEESAKKEEEGQEKQLDEKLADIEKVLEKFSEETPLGTGASPFKNTVSDIDLNKPIDFQKLVATEYIKPFITQQSSSPQDRIALLLQELKKQGLA